jgi:hypothetical protein
MWPPTTAYVFRCGLKRFAEVKSRRGAGQTTGWEGGRAARHVGRQEADYLGYKDTVLTALVIRARFD